MLEEVLALLASFAVEHADWNVLLIETYPVTHHHHEHHRHQKHDEQAAGIAPNLQNLLARDRQYPVRVHDRAIATSGSWSRVVSATNASSRVGRIRAMRLTSMASASRAALTFGIVSAASRITTCIALPKTAASRTPSTAFIRSSARPRGAAPMASR